MSLLGLGTHDFAYNLGFACSRSLSAAAVLLLQGHLLFKWTNPLLRRQLDTTGAPSLTYYDDILCRKYAFRWP